MISIKDYIVANGFKKACTKLDDKRDAGLSLPDDIEVIRDLSYGPNGTWNLLDLYLPKNRGQLVPVLVSAHGGGFVYGDKERYQYYTAQFASMGFGVVNFNYTLAPKACFPGPIIETNMVYEWIAANADKYGLDKYNIVMIGDSAGAQITSQYATVVSNPEYAKIMGIKVPDIKLKAVSLGCGLYSIEGALKSETRSLITTYVKNYDKQGEKLNVLNYINENYPAAYVISSPGDFLLENAEPMYNLLKERNVETEMKIYGDKETYHVFFCDMRSEVGKEANKDQAEFLLRYISKAE